MKIISKASVKIQALIQFKVGLRKRTSLEVQTCYQKYKPNSSLVSQLVNIVSTG